MEFKSVNPATGETIRYVAFFDLDEIEERIQRASDTFLSYRSTSFEERAGWMTRLGELLDNQAETLAPILTQEMGKPIRQAEAELRKCAWTCRYFAEHAEIFLAPIQKETDALQSYVTFQPLGPILAIMPWNFPFWQVIRFAAPALMAGNVALLKHAPNVPACALTIERLFREAGFPEGVFQNLFIDVTQVPLVLDDWRVRGSTLTGSVRAGRAVGAESGKVIKKSVLELGGSDPFVVLEDADLEKAVSVGIQARIQNNGQSCIAAKRFILVRTIANAFIERFVEEMKNLKMGDPMDPEVQLGPIARADLRDQLHDQVERSIAAGARLLLGGVIPQNSGFFYPPTVLTDVTPGMAVFDEETFGPVAAMVIAEDEEDALRLANLSRYGLGGAVFTQDLERGERFALRMECGNAFVNGMVKSDPRLPFGGVKESGYGRELSEFGIREFTNVKTIWIGN